MKERPYLSGTPEQIRSDLLARRAEVEAAAPESLVLFWQPGSTPEKDRADGERVRKMALAELDRLLIEWAAK